MSASAVYDFSSLKRKKIAIAGATGAVGAEFLKIFSQTGVPAENITLLASERSAGKKIHYLHQELSVEKLDENSFSELDMVLFSAGSSVSRKYRQACQDHGCVLIDNSSAFRMEDGVPLVVPEINPEDIETHSGVIANPNCSTIIMLMAVFPLHRRFPVKRIVVSTYQAASGAGWAAMQELKDSTLAFLEERDFKPGLFAFPYAFNLFSHNSSIDSSLYCEEERKMIQETQKILHDSGVSVAPTCIRVPILRAHSESINIEFQGEAPSLEEARNSFKDFPGVRLVDEPEKNHFPMPLEASGRYECLVGRIRKDISQPDRGLELFVSGDQLLKGAALNAVQIAALL